MVFQKQIVLVLVQVQVRALLLVVLLAAATLTASAEEIASTTTMPPPPPTCQSLGENWYFPNDCNGSCMDDIGSDMDLDRSRNVNNQLKCYCVGHERPFCTDTPSCEDLGVLPGTAEADCALVCGESATDVRASTGVNDNGYQFHYVVQCSCDGGATKRCGDDSVLFSDLDYAKSCTTKRVFGGKSNSLEIGTEDECNSYCVDTLVFEGGIFSASGKNKTCACAHPNIQTLDAATAKEVASALACDDNTARANDASGLGDPCYENVGVNSVDCPEPSSSSAAGSDGETTNSVVAKTLVSSTAIMGIWMLPW